MRIGRLRTIRPITLLIKRGPKGFGVDSPQRLLLRALLEGMGDAVRRNDESAGDRYYRRLGLIARHFDTNPPLSDTLEQLLSASGRWLATRVAERYEPENQVIEQIGLVLELL
jgi:hypothetical protein